jgi:hypothetical protein
VAANWIEKARDMKTKLSTLVGATALLLGVVGSSSAFAQGTWNLGTSSTAAGSCNAAGTPATANCGAGASGSTGGVQAAISGYSNNGSGGVFVQGSLSNNDPSGFGMIASGESTASPNHAFDNMTSGGGGTQEFMLINFGTAKVNLSGLQIGWSNGTGADMSIYYWSGNTAGTPGAADTALVGGWKLVSSMDAWSNGTSCDNPNTTTPSEDANCRTFNAANGDLGTGGLNMYSSWWLISTYVGSSTNKGLDAAKDDSFKLLAFTANTCTGTLSGGSTGGTSGTGYNNNGNGASCTTTGTPEPGSLALAGLALVGVFAARCRAAALQAA